jgi:hypothetical protein
MLYKAFAPSEGVKCSNDHNLLANLLFFSQTWYLYQNKCCLVTNKWRLNNIILQIVTMFSTMAATGVKLTQSNISFSAL